MASCTGFYDKRPWKPVYIAVQVKPFGSFATGTSTVGSDLDLVISLPQVHHEAGPTAPGFLEGRNTIKQSWQQILSRCLSNEAWVDASSIKIIGNTTVPVLKLSTVPGAAPSICLDISFEDATHYGLKACKVVGKLLATFPTLRWLVIVLKLFLQSRHLAQPFTGGLSSYAVLLLVAQFLQTTGGVNAPIVHGLQGVPVDDVGAQLLGFLEFFGYHFDTRLFGVRSSSFHYFVRPSLNYMAVESANTNSHAFVTPLVDRRHSFADTNTPVSDGNARLSQPQLYMSHYSGIIPYTFDPLFIEDPILSENNVGRNCFRVVQVQKCFQDFHRQLVELFVNSVQLMDNADYERIVDSCFKSFAMMLDNHGHS